MKESWEMARREYTGEKPTNPFGQEMNIYQARWQRHGWDVKQAIEEGKPVPPEVIADYPEFIQKVS